MGKAASSDAGMTAALRAEFDAEVRALIASASPFGPIEAVMRLRALAEISQALDTSGLLELAADIVDQTNKSGGDDRGWLSGEGP